MMTTNLLAPESRRRETEPTLNGYGEGGFGFLAGRDNAAILPNPNAWNAEYLFDLYRVWELRSAPLTLLRILARLHPPLARKIRNDTTLLCQDDAVRPRCMVKDALGREAEDPEGSAILHDFYHQAGAGFGGLMGGLGNNIEMLLLSGLCGIESLPGPTGSGVTALFTADPLTLAYSFSDGVEALPVCFQRQSSMPDWWDAAKRGNFMGWVDLSPDTFHTAAHRRTSDNPYGQPILCTYLNVGLRDFDRMRYLDRAFRKIAWPHLNIELDLKQIADAAVALGMTADRAAEFVQDQVERAKDAYRSPMSDDTLFTPSGSAHVLPGGDFRGMQNATALYHLEGAQALDSPPFLLGHTDTTTEAQAREQMRFAAPALEQERALGLMPFAAAGTLHLQLLGRPGRADFEVEPVRTSDELLDAQVESARTETYRQWVRRGLANRDEEAMSLTGHAPVAEPMPGAYDNPRSVAQNEPSEPGVPAPKAIPASTSKQDSQAAQDEAAP